jgi:hypothetical protein
MIAFEVFINGNKVCTAGVKEFGDLCAHLNWRRGPHVPSVTAFQQEFELSEFVVAGVRVRYKSKKAPHLKRGFAYSESLEWVRHEFRPGDEVTIRMVEVSSVDKPRKRKSLGSRDDSLRAHKRYIRGAVEALGWKIQK